jgi:hypothetical protein
MLSGASAVPQKADHIRAPAWVVSWPVIFKPKRKERKRFSPCQRVSMRSLDTARRAGSAEKHALTSQGTSMPGER